MKQESDPQIDMTYAYLMDWYIMHCPSLMHTPASDSGSAPFVQRLERSKWRVLLLSFVRQILSHWENYFVRPSSVRIPGGSLGICYIDLEDLQDSTRYT